MTHAELERQPGWVQSAVRDLHALRCEGDGDDLVEVRPGHYVRRQA